ncbi:hypothetical protein JKY72_03935 [Candidatus Gracilibacteria bacterium]|nr:hypothetical protein [Candidatus Gracilibacteria bacterium]
MAIGSPDVKAAEVKKGIPGCPDVRLLPSGEKVTREFARVFVPDKFTYDCSESCDEANVVSGELGKKEVIAFCEETKKQLMFTLHDWLRFDVVVAELG